MFVNARTLREYILGAGMDAVSVEVVTLEELGPKLSFGELVWYTLYVFLLHCRVRLEHRLYDVRRQVVLEPVTAVCLRLDIRLQIQPLFGK